MPIVICREKSNFVTIVQPDIIIYSPCRNHHQTVSGDLPNNQEIKDRPKYEKSSYNRYHRARRKFPL